MEDEFKLGVYHIYPKHNKVSSEESVVKIEPKIMQVLCLLASNQGIVFSRQDIADKLWPETIVGLEVITRAIFELRKVLADDPKKPKYIETIARKGYCFIGQIEPITTPTQRISIEKPYKRKTLLTYSLSTILFCGLIALFINVLLSETPASSITGVPTHYQSAILSDGNTNIQSAAISSDWSKLLYIQTTKQPVTSSVMVKDTKTHESSVIETGVKEYRSPIWSKEKDVGYFVQCIENNCEIVNFNLNANSMHIIFKSKHRIQTIQLSGDSKKIALTLSKKNSPVIALLTIKTGQLQFLPTTKSFNNYAPTFTADSSALYYIEKNNGQSKIKHIDLLTQKESIVSNQFSKITSLYLLSDKSLLIAGQVSSHQSIWRFDVDTKEISQVKSIEANNQAYNLVANKDLQQLFYLSKSSNFDIAAKGLPSAVNLKSLNSHANDLNSLWSNTNQAIFFVSQRTGQYELWSYSNNVNKKLTNIFADIIERPILNRDQTKLAFVAQVNNNLHLYIYDLAKQQMTLTQEVEQQSHLLSWSNNDNSIYMSIASENMYDIWQFDIAKQQKKQVALSAGLIAIEQKEDHLIFGDLRSRQLMIKNSNGSTKILKSFKNIPLLVRPHSIKYQHKNQRLFYVERHLSEQKIISSSITDISKQQELFSLSTDSYITDLGMNESNYVLFDKLTSNASQLVLLNAIK